MVIYGPLHVGDGSMPTSNGPTHFYVSERREAFKGVWGGCHTKTNTASCGGPGDHASFCGQADRLFIPA